MLFAKLFDLIEVALKRRQGIAPDNKRSDGTKKARKKVTGRV
jgi:hypothetical protein